MRDDAYFRSCTARIANTRDTTADALRAEGYSLTDSRANFLLARSPRLPGAALYEELKKRGILVRHLPDPRIRDSIRITVGTDTQMQTLLDAVRDIEKEASHA